MPGAEVAVPRAGEPRGVAVWLAPGSPALGPDAFGEPGLVGCIALVGRNPLPLCTPHSCLACPVGSPWHWGFLQQWHLHQDLQGAPRPGQGVTP